MGIRIHFVSHFSHFSLFDFRSRHFEKWREHYSPPWPLLFHLAQFIYVLYVYATLILRSTTNIYQIREMFNDYLFPKEDDFLFSSFDDLYSAIDKFSESLIDLKTDSFHHFAFTNSSQTVVTTYEWLNGTTTNTPINISQELFRHVSAIVFSSEFTISNNDSEISGCTQWEAQLHVELQKGSFLFKGSSSLVRSSCSKSDIIEFFSPESISFTKPTLISGVRLIEISVVYFITTLSLLVKSFNSHHQLLRTNPKYKDLSTYEQFHYSVGFWQIFNFFSNVIMIISSVFLIQCSKTMTQFPTLNSMILFGFAGLFVSASTIQWLTFLPRCYAVALVIRQGFKKLCFLISIFAPVLMGLMFVCVFLFGFFMETTQNFIDLYQLMLSVIFGDSVYVFYGLTTDGSLSYNILSFLYSTIITAILIWVFYTLFTALMVKVYRSGVAKFLGNQNIA